MTVSGYRAPLAITGVTAVTDALRAECAACDAAYNRHGALVTAHGDLASAVSTVRFYAPNERSRPFPEVCLSVRVRYVVVVCTAHCVLGVFAFRSWRYIPTM